MIRYLFVFFFLCLNLLVEAQCPQVYDYNGNLSANPLFISCSGNPYGMSIQSNTSWGTYTVNWGDGNPDATGAAYTANSTIPHTYAAATNSYVLTLTIASPACTFTAPVIVEKPVAASIQIPVTGVTQACAPKTLTFTNSSTNVSGTTTFTWNFGDGSPDVVFTSTNVGQDVTHLYNKGTVNCQTQVTLRAENACRFGNPSVANFNPLQIYDIDIANITPDRATRCWPDNTFQFSNSTNRNCVPEGNIFQRQEKWNFGDYWGFGHDSIIGWTPWPPSLPVSVTYTAMGTYTVLLLDSNMCGVDDVVISVSIVPPPVASLVVPSGTLCQNTSVTFTNASSTGVTYLWDFGDGGGFVNIGTGNKNHTYTSPGTYTVRLVARVPGGGPTCSDTSSQVVTILARPVSNFTLSPAAGCNSITVSFTNTSTGDVAWNWLFANGNTSTLQAPPPENYTLTGTFVPTLVVTASTSCTHASTRTITIRPKPVPHFSQFAACVGTSVTFTNNSTPVSGTNSIITQKWDFGDATPASTLLTPAHTYTAPGTYTVKLVAASAFCVDSISQPVFINVKPAASFVATPTAGCHPLTVSFSNSSQNATNYLWKFTTGTSAVSTATNPSFTFTNATQNFQSYTVTLIVSVGACMDSTKRSVTVWPKPVANFTTNTITGCSPLITNFSNTSTGYQLSAWDFGDGGTDNVPNPSHTYTNTSLFTQTVIAGLIVTSSLSCTDTVQKLITVYPEALTVFSMVPASGCSPLLVNFISVPGVAVYTWNHGDGSPTYTTLTAHLWTYTNTTNVNQTSVITLTAQTSNGCIGYGSGSVTVFYNPVADFTVSPAGGCSPLSVTFNNTSTGQVSNSWQFGNGQSSADLHPSSTYTNAQGAGQRTYEAKLKVGTSSNCYDSITKPIVLLPQPKAAFHLDTPACSPKKILMSSSSIGAGSYHWDFGDGLSSTVTTTNVTHEYVNSSAFNQTYSVKLIAISPDNCKDSLTVPMVVHPKPAYFISSKPDNGCSPLEVFFDSIVGVKQYQWKYDGISFSNAGNIRNIFDNKDPFPKTINIELIASDIYTCSDTATKQITVYPLPTAKFSAKPITVFIPNQPTFFTNESSPEQLSYRWDFGDGETSREKSPSYTYKQAGEYQSVLIVENSFGCVDTFQLPNKVTALAETTIEMPNAFSPNISGSQGSFFDPNDDSNDIFHPNIKGTEKYQFSIYSRWGELLFETKNPDEGWDGYYKGKLCTQDVYIWKIVATFIDGRTYNKTGDLLLLR